MDPIQPDNEPAPVLRLDDDIVEPEIVYLGRGEELSTRDRKMIRGFGKLSWFVVICLTLFMVASVMVMQLNPPEAEMSSGELIQPVMMGKFALGLRELANQPGGDDLDSQSRDFMHSINAGPIEQRFCYAILQNELEGPDEALATLDWLRGKTSDVGIEYSDHQLQLEQLLSGIFEENRQGMAAQVSSEEQALLNDHLAWFGDLAVASRHSNSGKHADLVERAEFTAILFAVGVIAAIALLGIGLIVFFIFMARLLSGAMKSRVADNSRYGPVYIETFAIWFILFLGISVAAALASGDGIGIPMATLQMVLPLSALFWPILRGVPTADLLEDIGLKWTNPFPEILAGIAAYLAMLPVMAIGLLVSFVMIALMGLLQSTGGPASEFAPMGAPHPIANEAFGGDVVQVMITILFVAAVLAPVTEEIMFRGVLYRNLRDSSHRMARWGSVMFAAFFSSLIFASIHPQGLVGIPVLTVLAFGFCLVRQWRGSLIAPITMHAIHNSVATSFLIPVLI